MNYTSVGLACHVHHGLGSRQTVENNLATITKEKLSCVGHVMHRTDNGQTTNVTERQLMRNQERQRIRWTDEIRAFALATDIGPSEEV